MKLLEAAKSKPGVAITTASVLGVLFMLSKLNDALPGATRMLGHVDAAYAGEARSKENREWIDQYIQQQNQQRELEQQRYELEQEFKERILEMQGQRQAPKRYANPNQPTQPLEFFEEQETDESWWCCEARHYDDCWEDNLWYSC